MAKPVSIWFMEGVSSQKDMLALVKMARTECGKNFLIIASHRNERPEILSEADIAYLEPDETQDLLPFIAGICTKHNVVAIHAGKRGHLLERYRDAIDEMGVKLTTGATSLETFELADNKAEFSVRMMTYGLPSVVSIKVQSPDELASAIEDFESRGVLPCIKPVKGIYGLGFWILKRTAKTLSFYNNPDYRQMHPDVAIASLQRAELAGEELPIQIVMPYLPGPEHSVDMLVENGRVLAAVARTKIGSLQTLENEGPAYQLALDCAKALGADGLINVQTRNDENGMPVLLEANLRPSGGIGYTAHSEVNLPGLYALKQLGIISDDDVLVNALRFKSITVIPTHSVKPLSVCSITPSPTSNNQN
ncbi:Carbamoyl-phosphate synthase large chain (plasmid) [Pantoea vagans C9-1]|uniref:ATP-grasp domain-containing protein n=1 Tax=Pantoea vagans TaxID=470934 RepID=UPI0001E5790A|nr:ATP-grasp domain-containing protein [Pantoea vagans]ADO08015.1 Carbamoyl-phosphate synthase large chain [Pantoea vagans C9-1]